MASSNNTQASGASGFEALVRRDRTIVAAVLVAIAGLCWAYLIHLAAIMAGSMSAMHAMTMAWSAMDALLMFIMWAVMMIGMMLPSAAPMILLYGLVIRKQAGRGVVFAPTAVFAGGYLLAWAAFSAAATVLQWGLEQTGLVTSMTSGMTSVSAPWFAGALLIAAGLYQWTPLKAACLTHCRNPMDFLSRSWRSGTGGAVVMGLHHGIYCIGCCWALMLIEKIAPAGRVTGYLTGGVMAGMGIILLA